MGVVLEEEPGGRGCGDLKLPLEPSSGVWEGEVEEWDAGPPSPWARASPKLLGVELPHCVSLIKPPGFLWRMWLACDCCWPAG